MRERAHDAPREDPPSVPQLAIAARPRARAGEGAPRHEIRFGLVLYGGISLATYIYGVTLEFWRLARASCEIAEGRWADLLNEAEVSAAVDIVSGASAGGINGVLLGKALAAGGDMRAVRSLWIDEGDLENLLERQTNRDPLSLLRTDRFEELIRKGLAEMDNRGDGKPLVSVFDLFTPGTRLEPWGRSFPTDLKRPIETRDYRKIFQLRYRRTVELAGAAEIGYERNDFGPDRNETLMRVARATSAFPGAFRPRHVAKDEQDCRYFAGGEPRAGYFSDGGILHNKPFTETISTIFTRAADQPVQRWLVSVEPDPEHNAPPAEICEPEVSEVLAKAVFGIPRYQSIAADLARLQEHRRRTKRARALLGDIDAALTTRLADIAAAPEDEAPPLASLLGDAALVGVYRRERRREFASDIATRVAAAGGLSEDQVEPLEGAVNDAVAQVRAEQLEAADASFARRRQYHLLELLDPDVAPDPAVRAQLEEHQRRLWWQFDQLERVWWELLNPDEPLVPGLPDLRRQSREPLMKHSRAIAGAVVEHFARRLPAIGADALDTCRAIDHSLEGVTRPDPAVRFTQVCSAYEAWDALTLQLERMTGGPARDRINLARISPDDAYFIDKPGSDKLAGDSLGHFGGFLKREWRHNDLLWGRLDAAEVIVRMIAKDRLPDAAVPGWIRAMQEDIVAEELPDVAGDYKTYLEQRWCVGRETLTDVPVATRTRLLMGSAGVVRNMMRRIERTAPAPAVRTLVRWVGRLVGLLLFWLRLPTLAAWGRDPGIRHAAKLLTLFLVGWAVLVGAAACFNVIEPTLTMWALVAATVLIFVIHSWLVSRFK